MAKIKEKPVSRIPSLPFTRKNYFIFGLGLLLILVGYIFLAQGPAESFLSLSVAPVFLFVGYCIIIPLAILYRDKNYPGD